VLGGKRENDYASVKEEGGGPPLTFIEKTESSYCTRKERRGNGSLHSLATEEKKN